MAEPNADILKTLAEAVNDLREYLRVTAQRRPEMDFGDSQLLPERIELPAQDARQTQATPVEDVVIPLPRQRHYEGGCLLPEDSEGAPSPNFAIHHHYSMSRGDGVFPETVTFFSESGFRWASIQIGLTLRKCAENLPIGDHPGYQKPVFSGALAGASRGNTIDSYAGDDSTWLELAYSAFENDGTDLGHGIEVVTGFHIHARVTAAGLLELRSTNDGLGTFSCVITGAGERITYPANPHMKEFGAGGCHDDRVWGDGDYELGSYSGNDWVPA